jgi:PadR family transcriptional regulator, regulatory protein PadR
VAPRLRYMELDVESISGHPKNVQADPWLPEKLSLWWSRLLSPPLDTQWEACMLPLNPRGSEFMTDRSSEVIQGTLDMLILKTLALEPMHAWGVAVRIEQVSRGVFRPNAGSLFVAFQRLQRAGLIKSEWKATENNRRAKYYTSTESGRRKLNSETREWERQVAAIARILEAS